MIYLKMITLFFHVYRVIFIIVLIINILAVIADYNNKDELNGMSIIYWTLFIMSWYF